VFSTAFRLSVRAQTLKPTSRVQVTCVVDRQGHLKQWAER